MMEGEEEVIKRQRIGTVRRREGVKKKIGRGRNAKVDVFDICVVHGEMARE